jgi:hypothetical protein
MRRLQYLIGVWILSTAAILGNVEAFQKGVEAYNEGEIEAALAHWESVPGESAALHYNIANAWYRMGQSGKAVWHYEKALLFNPNDEDVLNNLALVREGLIDKFDIIPQPVYKTVVFSILKLGSLQFWTIGSLVLLFVAVVFLGWMFFGQQHRKVLMLVFLIALLAGFAFRGLATLRFNYLDAQRHVVVLFPNIYVKTAPQDTGIDSFILHEGTTGVLLEEQGDWVKLRLPDGKIGWAKSDGLGVVSRLP